MEERVSLDRALEIIDEKVDPLSLEATEVMFAEGRVLAERIASWIDLPSASVTKMDGYALIAGDIETASPENPVSLNVIGSAAAASPFEGEVENGQCVRVSTGAVVPADTDAVVPLEKTEISEDKVLIKKCVTKGNDIREKGDELHISQAVAEPGIILTPGYVGFLIASGWVEVKCVRFPRIRVIATGDEIKQPGTSLLAGEVYPSGSATVAALCRMMGVEDVRLNVVGDHPYEVQDAFPGAHGADLVVTIGGTGKGEKDVVMQALASLGVEMLFKGVNTKPGHFASFGMLEEMPVVCLPGGPGAAEMMFQFLVRRTIYALKGIYGREMNIQWAILDKSLKAHNDVDKLVRVRVKTIDKNLHAFPSFAKGVHQEIAKGNGVIRVMAGQNIEEGELAPVYMTE